MSGTKVCPRCDEPYRGYPALSRRDNKTDICSACGNAEAMNDFARDPFEMGIEQFAIEKAFHKKIGVDFKKWVEWKKSQPKKDYIL